jgi:hypothetical protein
MLKDLKLAFCSVAVTSASFSQTGAFGYGAAVAIAAALLFALGRAIWRSLFQAEQGGRFEFRDTRAARRRSERIFNPLLLFAVANPALPNKTATNQDHRHVQT